MNYKLKTILAAGFLVTGMAAQACSLSAWDLTTGTPAGGGPADANVIVRYSGLCGMDGTSGTVTNNGTVAVSGPAGEASMIARFYFLASGAGTATLFETYSENGATTPVYTVTYDGSNVTVTPASGGAAAVVAVGGTNWHSVEVKWAAGDGATGGAVDVWVDSDAVTAAADASTTSAVTATSIQAAQLGGIANAGFTQILVDDYESRRSTAIGRLMVGDGSGDGVRGLNDAVLILNEVLSPVTTLVTGTPDTNENGLVELNDAIISLNLFLTGAP